MSLNEEDYRRLLAFRTGVRRFLKWSERQARAAGLTPKQHQLLLAVRGHDDPRGPTIKEASEYLLLRHNSTVELVDRALMLCHEPDAGFVVGGDGDPVLVEVADEHRAPDQVERHPVVGVGERRPRPERNRLFARLAEPPREGPLHRSAGRSRGTGAAHRDRSPARHMTRHKQAHLRGATVTLWRTTESSSAGRP